MWPKKYSLFDINISATSYQEALDCIISAAQKRTSALVDHMPVHGLITAVSDPEFRNTISNFEIVAPDGQPVRWALNSLHKCSLKDRVYGPTLMLILCEKAAECGVGIYLYGSTQEVIAELQKNLLAKFPNLIISGTESPPFRQLTEEEDAEMVKRINYSSAGLVFIGLGCPKQEIFAFKHKEKIKAVQLCVGAAFDFHAGTLRQAPKWIQNAGFEWLFRLVAEPKRLWKRYFTTNIYFLYLFVKHKFFLNFLK